MTVMYDWLRSAVASIPSHWIDMIGVGGAAFFAGMGVAGTRCWTW